MKDPLTEGLKEAGEVLKKVYTDFMKIYEREDKVRDRENWGENQPEPLREIPPMQIVNRMKDICIFYVCRCWLIFSTNMSMESSP